MRKVAIIYQKTGGGHLSLAQAVEEAIYKYYPNEFKVHLVDPFPDTYSSTYRRVSADLQELYKAQFDITNNEEVSHIMHSMNTLVIQDKLKSQLAAVMPDIVISNHPFGTSEVSSVIRDMRLKCKFVIHVADPFTIHNCWLTCKDADLYLCPTDISADCFIKNGVEKSRVKTVGWIVRNKFLEEMPAKDIVRHNLGFDENKFTIFLGGSGQGGGKVFDLCQYIVKNQALLDSAQVIVNTGMNRHLLGRVMDLAEDHPKFFQILPYVNNIPQLLTASDVVVGKAGPNFLFESIFMKRPFIATGCLPGQEDGNLDFIINEDLGWVEKDTKKAVSLIQSVMENPALLQGKAVNVDKIRKQNSEAGQKITALLKEL